jgi:hypothetical protein
MSLIERVFAREKPARRILRASTVAMSSGLGNRRPGKSAMKRPRIASAARPWICWCAMARTSVSKGC